MKSSGFCRSYPFSLALADIVSFIFSDEGKHLEHNVAEKCPYQVLPTAGIQEGHVDHVNADPDLFREDPPLLLDFFVVTAKTADALDIKQVVLFQLLQ